MAQGHGVRRTHQTIDELLELEDGAGAITTSAVGSTASLDLGGGGQANTPMMYGDIMIDVSAITTGGATGETYTLILEGSNSATFASGIESLAICELGDVTESLGNADVVSTTGRYVVPFTNEKNGNTYRYVRMYFLNAGTSPSITCTVFLAKGVGV